MEEKIEELKSMATSAAHLKATDKEKVCREQPKAQSNMSDNKVNKTDQQVLKNTEEILRKQTEDVQIVKEREAKNDQKQEAIQSQMKKECTDGTSQALVVANLISAQEAKDEEIRNHDMRIGNLKQERTYFISQVQQLKDALLEVVMNSEEKRQKQNKEHERILSEMMAQHKVEEEDFQRNLEEIQRETAELQNVKCQLDATFKETCEEIKNKDLKIAALKQETDDLLHQAKTTKTAYECQISSLQEQLERHKRVERNNVNTMKRMEKTISKTIKHSEEMESQYLKLLNAQTIKVHQLERALQLKEATTQEL